MGNRLAKDDSVDGLTTYAYDSNDRLLSETTNGVTTTYTYDANGNLLSEVNPDQQVVYTWSDENRLVGATITTAEGTQQVEYVYDADGIRVAKTVDGEETRYLIDANRQYAQVLEEYDATTGTEVAYVYGNELISQTRGTENDFYLSDGHSGIRQLTDETGAVTDSYLYDAYGNVLKRIGESDNDYLYRGEQTDSETGLQYLRARYNDTDAGRFISTDPFEGMVEMPVSRHRYLYGNDNPIVYSDPSGMFSLPELALVQRNLAYLATSAIVYGTAGYAVRKISGEVKWSGVYGQTTIAAPIVGLSYAPLGVSVIEAFLVSEPVGNKSTYATVLVILAVGSRVSPLPFGSSVSTLDVLSPAILGRNATAALSGPVIQTAASFVTPFSVPFPFTGRAATLFTLGPSVAQSIGTAGGLVDIGLTLSTGISIAIGFDGAPNTDV